jgi:hypothetical protein
MGPSETDYGEKVDRDQRRKKEERGKQRGTEAERVGALER